MVYEARKQSMAWMETDYSKHTHFPWKIKWPLKHLGALGIMVHACQQAKSEARKKWQFSFLLCLCLLPRFSSFELTWSNHKHRELSKIEPTGSNFLQVVPAPVLQEKLDHELWGDFTHPGIASCQPCWFHSTSCHSSSGGDSWKNCSVHVVWVVLFRAAHDNKNVTSKNRRAPNKQNFSILTNLG